ncbi:Ribosome-binding factor A [Planctomycetes bacterium Poly30]|uniref:Ribosome-binding factor A n=1 Tax=Saltatorellus ferox TaxID=2528018 RepID=A0A518EWZ3_9BACT|nr:Ribosome-binding factor A [Planctomycetes bacterium Poly30]
MANPRTVARLEVQIQRRIAHCLQFELADPRSSFITIQRIELNSDLSTAKAHYSVLGSEADRSKAKHMLEHANGFIRKQMGSILRTRSIPQLRWVYDESIAGAEAMEDLLERTMRRDAEIRGEAVQPPPPPGEASDEAEEAEDDPSDEEE